MFVLLISFKFQGLCGPEDSELAGEVFPLGFCYGLAAVNFLVAVSPSSVAQYFKHFGTDAFYCVSIIPGTIRTSFYFTSVGKF